MTRAYYDTEFFDDGHAVHLISIGIATDDGREYYAVSNDAPWTRIFREPWLMKHVWPHLPIVGYNPELFDPDRRLGIRPDPTGRGVIDFTDPAVKGRDVIADEVRTFLFSLGDHELCSWYSDYDHVALCQLWGPMQNLPAGLRMWTYELQQEAERLGAADSLPPHTGRLHHALDDARHHRTIGEHLLKLAAA